MTIRALLEITVLTGGNTMDDWIDKLKHEEDATAQRADANAKTENRHADVVAEKAQDLWDALVAQVKMDVEKVQQTFLGDPAKDVEYSVLNEGFSVARNGFPHIRIEVSWGKKTPTAAVWIFTQAYAGADEKSNREEISFCWATGDSVKMVFEGRSHMTAATLSEQVIRKILVR